MKLFWFLEGRDDDARSTRSLDRQLGASRAILWLVAISLAAFIGWAHYAEIDQITRAPGTVIASLRSQVIQSQEGGTIAELRIKEG